ncbi:MAG: zinc-ribbon domain-containing protein [Gammaproteobacteria bacterium]|nr:zinc-ribbon domain-containing protein [Gammaproteobacteria bacterium]
MYSECPHCQVIFAVTAEQLSLRQGLVRCGSCRRIFNASWNLVDSLPPRSEPQPRLADHLAVSAETSAGITQTEEPFSSSILGEDVVPIVLIEPSLDTDDNQTEQEIQDQPKDSPDVPSANTYDLADESLIEEPEAVTEQPVSAKSMESIDLSGQFARQTGADIDPKSHSDEAGVDPHSPQWAHHPASMGHATTDVDYASQTGDSMTLLSEAAESVLSVEDWEPEDQSAEEDQASGEEIEALPTVEDVIETSVVDGEPAVSQGESVRSLPGVLIEPSETTDESDDIDHQNKDDLEATTEDITANSEELLADPEIDSDSVRDFVESTDFEALDDDSDKVSKHDDDVPAGETERAPSVEQPLPESDVGEDSSVEPTLDIEQQEHTEEWEVSTSDSAADVEQQLTELEIEDDSNNDNLEKTTSERFELKTSTDQTDQQPPLLTTPDPEHVAVHDLDPETDGVTTDANQVPAQQTDSTDASGVDQATAAVSVAHLPEDETTDSVTTEAISTQAQVQVETGITDVDPEHDSDPADTPVVEDHDATLFGLDDHDFGNTSAKTHDDGTMDESELGAVTDDSDIVEIEANIAGAEPESEGVSEHFPVDDITGDVPPALVYQENQEGVDTKTEDHVELSGEEKQDSEDAGPAVRRLVLELPSEGDGTAEFLEQTTQDGEIPQSEGSTEPLLVGEEPTSDVIVGIERTESHEHTAIAEPVHDDEPTAESEQLAPSESVGTFDATQLLQMQTEAADHTQSDDQLSETPNENKDDETEGEPEDRRGEDSLQPREADKKETTSTPKDAAQAAVTAMGELPSSDRPDIAAKSEHTTPHEVGKQASERPAAESIGKPGSEKHKSHPVPDEEIVLESFAYDWSALEESISKLQKSADNRSTESPGDSDVGSAEALIGKTQATVQSSPSLSATSARIKTGAASSISPRPGGFDDAIATQNATTFGSRRVRLALWTLGSLSLLVLLIGQFGYFYWDDLAQNATTRSYMARLCDIMKCDVPPQRAAELIDLVQTKVAPHPGVPGALRVTASLLNKAEYPQPYPTLQISLTDVEGKLLGRRSFRPSQYLVRESSSGLNLSPNVATQVALDLADPHENAVGYEVELVSP